MAVLGVLAIAGVSASCGDSSATKTSASSDDTASQKGPIIVGAAIAQTGAMAPYDVPPLAYVKRAISDINDSGGLLGRKVELKVSDTKSDIPSVGSTALGLLGDGAQLIITTCDFNYGGPAALAAQEKGVLGLSPCAESPAFGKQRIGPLAFTFGMATPTQSAAMAEYSYDRLKKRKAFLLLDPAIVYDKDICNYFKQRWSAMPGASIAGEDTFSANDASISGQINRIQSSGADEVVLCSVVPQAVSAIKQIRAAGFKGPILAPGSLDGSYWLKSVPSLSNFYNVAYASIYGDDPNPKVNELVREGKPAASFALAGYSLIEGWAKAVKEAGTTDGEAVAAELEKFHDVPLPSGAATFTPDMHITLIRPISIIGTSNGKREFKGVITPKDVPQPKF